MSVMLCIHKPSHKGVVDSVCVPTMTYHVSGWTLNATHSLAAKDRYFDGIKMEEHWHNS